MVTTGAVGLVSGGPAGASTDPGIGSSYAQGFQVTPHEGSLAVGGVFDEALAGHTDHIARAQSQGLDLGAVGASIKGYNCGQPGALAAYVPSPLQAETPSNGGSAESSAGPSPNDNNSDGSVEHVSANDQPYGEADTTFAGPIAAPNNFVAISAVVSKAWSGLIDGNRDAGATADIGSVTIAGVVTLSHLHWAADYPSNGQSTSSFTIGSATINGTSVPTADPSAVINAVNQALGAIGVQVALPAATATSGIQFESPMQIEVVPNSTRNGITDPIITQQVEPNYYPIANGLENGFANTSGPLNALAPVEQNDPSGQLQAALCQSDTPITVADVTMASITQGGYFNIALGGVNASSGPLPPNGFNLAEFNFGALTSSGSNQFLPGTSGTPAIAGTPGQSLSAGTGSNGSGGSGSTASQHLLPAATVTAAAAGPLLGIGLGVLALLGLLAEADRRVIRRASNTASFEE